VVSRVGLRPPQVVLERKKPAEGFPQPALFSAHPLSFSEREKGFETDQHAGFTALRDISGTTEPTRVDASARTVDDPGPSDMQTARIEDPIEAALLLAARAGRFDVVSQLAKELEARRLEGGNVVPLVASGTKR